MRSVTLGHRCRLLAALAGGVLVSACAPDRVPGSTVAEGDAGIAFHQELASLRGAGAPRHGPGGASGASYGGGSSSAAGVRVATTDLLDQPLRGTGCGWAVSTAAFGPSDSAPSAIERAKVAPSDEPGATGCAAPAETR